MTYFMYISGCHGVTPTPMSSLFIVRVLLGHTVDDSSYVYKWLPLSNPLCHRYGCHGVPHPYVIAIYIKVLPYTTHKVVTHPYLREIVLPKVQRSRSLSPDIVANDVRVQRSL